MRLTTIASLTCILVLFAGVANAGTITASLLNDESDIINTGGAVHSAVHFQNPTAGDPSPLVVNGIAHIVGQANEPLLTDNIGFEGDFRNGSSGLPQDGSDIIQVLLSGIAGANGLTLDIAGLTVGTEYLFQAYWEDDRGTTLTVTIAGETVLNSFFDRDDSVGGDVNNWLSGYSLQEVPEPTSLALLGIGSLLGLTITRRRRA